MLGRLVIVATVRFYIPQPIMVLLGSGTLVWDNSCPKIS